MISILRKRGCRERSVSVALGGLDRLVFIGGIGEKGATIRSRVIKSLSCLNIHLDETRNASAIQQEARISSQILRRTHRE